MNRKNSRHKSRGKDGPGNMDTHNLARRVDMLRGVWEERMKLYTFKELKKAFPWLSQSLLAYWVKKGWVIPTQKSSGKGIPALWTRDDALKLAVFSIISSVRGYQAGLWEWIEERCPELEDEDVPAINIDWYMGLEGPIGELKIDVDVLRRVLDEAGE